MIRDQFSTRGLAVLLTGMLLVAACNRGVEETTPTPSVDEVQTQAVATFSAFQTATALAVPSNTPTETETPAPSPTATGAVTNTPTRASAGITPAASCYSLRFVSDVTIPDDTEMDPGEEFTKTWRVRNNGTCAWEEGLEFRFLGGDRMDGKTVTLEDNVQPQEQTDLSVEMTAPEDSGTYRGNWRMTSATGAFFGDEVYVRIIVEEGSATATATTAAGATATPSATSTQAPTATETETPEP